MDLLISNCNNIVSAAISVVENNPVSFNTVPLYIFEECNRAVFPDGIEV